MLSGMQLRIIFVSVLAVVLSACAGMQISDFKAGVTLPYSEHCFFVHAVSGKTLEYDKPSCERMKKKALIILSEDWKLIRKNFQTNCQMQQCKQLVGQFDALFLVVDDALKKIPLK